MLKRLVTTLAAGLVGAAMLAWVYIVSPPQLSALDNSLRDYFFHLRGTIPTSGDVVIIDIDDPSLAEYGQWPWERNLVAQLLQQLSDDGAGMIGLDIVFAEEDKTSPAYLKHKLNLAIDNPPDYDQVLGSTIAQTPTILGYVFNIETDSANASPPAIPAIMIEKGSAGQSFLVEAQGIVTNIPTIQDQAYSSGFFNNIPDESGQVRSVPLVIKYQDILYPSLSLEMLRIALNSQTVEVLSTENGVEHIQLGDLRIPTDRHGQMFLNYRGPSYTFQYISAVDVMQQNYNPADIEGKWVLIGTSAPGILDIRSMPLDNAFPGVEVHANALDNIISGDILHRPNWTEAADVSLLFLVFLISFVIFNYLGALGLSVTAIAGYYGLYSLIDYSLFEMGILLNVFFPTAALTLSIVLASLFNFFFETRQKNIIKEKLARKVSPSVMGELLRHESMDIMQGQTREVTIFFSDIRSFTHISETLSDPQKLIKLLNTYTTVMTHIITQKQGTIDKYIGDAIMAYWNAPVSQRLHADLAVSASIMQQQALEKLNEDILKDPYFADVADTLCINDSGPLAIGIGINTGEAVVGEMGSVGRSDFTVIGDTINLGSRLESLCKFYGSSLNISGQTKAKLTRPYIMQFLDKVKVKGKTEAVDIWQVHDFGNPSGQLKRELEMYHLAIELYQAGEFAFALEEFKKLRTTVELSNKQVYEIYIGRCLHYIDHEPENFDAVYEHTTK